MRYLIFIFFLCSCYSPKTAQKQIDKAYLKYPEIVAKTSSKLFPCDYSAHSIDSTAYFDYQKQIEAINEFYANAFIGDTIYKTDTQLIQVYRNCDRVVTKYKLLLKHSPILIDTIKIKDVADITALKYKFDKLSEEKNKINKNYIYSLKAIGWLFIILIVFLIFQIIKK